MNNITPNNPFNGNQGAPTGNIPFGSPVPPTGNVPFGSPVPPTGFNTPSSASIAGDLANLQNAVTDGTGNSQALQTEGKASGLKQFTTSNKDARIHWSQNTKVNHIIIPLRNKVEFLEAGIKAQVGISEDGKAYVWKEDVTFKPVDINKQFKDIKDKLGVEKDSQGNWDLESINQNILRSSGTKKRTDFRIVNVNEAKEILNTLELASKVETAEQGKFEAKLPTTEINGSIIGFILSTGDSVLDKKQEFMSKIIKEGAFYVKTSNDTTIAVTPYKQDSKNSLEYKIKNTDGKAQRNQVIATFVNNAKKTKQIWSGIYKLEIGSKKDLLNNTEFTLTKFIPDTTLAVAGDQQAVKWYSKKTINIEYVELDTATNDSKVKTMKIAVQLDVPSYRKVENTARLAEVHKDLPDLLKSRGIVGGEVSFNIDDIVKEGIKSLDGINLLMEADSGLSKLLGGL